MEDQETENPRKRSKQMDGDEEEVVDAAVMESLETEEVEETAQSEEMKHDISSIVDKIENFTNMVLELLESGKKLYKDLSDEYEDRIVMIHKEQIEKWQEEMRDLQLLDASNEENNALLRNARNLLHNIQTDR